MRRTAAFIGIACLLSCSDKLGDAAIDVCGSRYEIPFAADVVDAGGGLGDEDGDSVLYALPVDADESMPGLGEVEQGLAPDLVIIDRSTGPNRVSSLRVVAMSRSNPACTVGVSVLVNDLTLSGLNADSSWVLAVRERIERADA